MQNALGLFLFIPIIATSFTSRYVILCYLFWLDHKTLNLNNKGHVAIPEVWNLQVFVPKANWFAFVHSSNPRAYISHVRYKTGKLDTAIDTCQVVKQITS